MRLFANRSFVWLALLIAGLVVVSLVFSVSRPPRSQPQEDTTALRTPPPPPALTPERTVAAIGGKTFAALVSYTDSGFEPKETRIKKGDTVTFTNNSTGDMRITPEGLPYPENNENCKASALDTCVALPPGEYRDVTFTVAGDWRFEEKSGGARGVIRVE